MTVEPSYRLRRNMQTGGLTGDWYGTNQDGMTSDDGVFEFVFIPDTRLDAIADAWNNHKAACGLDANETRYKLEDLLDALTEENKT